LTLVAIRIDLYGCDGLAWLMLGSKRRPSEIQTAEKLNDDHRANLIAGFPFLVLADFMQIRQPIE